MGEERGIILFRYKLVYEHLPFLLKTSATMTYKIAVQEKYTTHKFYKCEYVENVWCKFTFWKTHFFI